MHFGEQNEVILTCKCKLAWPHSFGHDVPCTSWPVLSLGNVAEKWLLTCTDMWREAAQFDVFSRRTKLSALSVTDSTVNQMRVEVVKSRNVRRLLRKEDMKFDICCLWTILAFWCLINYIAYCRLISLINFFSLVIINWIIHISWHAQKPRVSKIPIQTFLHTSMHLHHF